LDGGANLSRINEVRTTRLVGSVAAPTLIADKHSKPRFALALPRSKHIEFNNRRCFSTFAAAVQGDNATLENQICVASGFIGIRQWRASAMI
jgi:hypothetical protein